MTPHFIHQNELEAKAAAFAFKAHDGQVRKYTGVPYISHPAEVATIVKSVPHTHEMVAAAWLHDVVEDCDVTIDEIEFHFGYRVATLVEGLTDISKPWMGNRKFRRKLDAIHTKNSCGDVHTIKYADIISNSSDIKEHDPAFAVKYLTEINHILDIATKGDMVLYAKARKGSRK